MVGLLKYFRLASQSSRKSRRSKFRKLVNERLDSRALLAADLCSASEPTFSEGEAAVYSESRMDLNEDGAITASDALMVAGALSELEGDSVPTDFRMDLTGDGQLTVGDFEYIADYLSEPPQQEISEFDDVSTGENSGAVTGSPTPVGPGGGGENEITANDDEYHTVINTGLSVFMCGVLHNDESEFGGGLSAILVSSTSNGTLDFQSDGSFYYEPNVNFAGIDTFTYKATDGQVESEVAEVTIYVMEYDMDIINTTGQVIDDEDEVSPGGYVGAAHKYYDPNAEEYDKWRLEFVQVVMRPVVPVEAGGFYTVSFAEGNIKVWQDQGGTQPVESGETVFSATSTTTLYVEGVVASEGNMLSQTWHEVDPSQNSGGGVPGDDDTIAIDICEAPETKPGDRVSLSVVKGDLQISNGHASPSPLSDKLELKKGGIVLLNDDDDDEDSKVDKSDGDGVKDGDNDLGLLYLRPVAPASAGGVFKLKFDSKKIKIWLSNEKKPNEAVLSETTELPVTGKSVFVEGVNVSDAIAQEEIELIWEKDNKGKAEKIEELDKVAYTVVQIDLDAHKVDANDPIDVLADSLEVTDGAYLPVNSDKDAYHKTKTDRSITNNQHENDLLKMTIAAIKPAIPGSTYSLTIPTNVKAWTTKDKAEQLTGESELEPGGAGTFEFWVEGVNYSAAGKNISLHWASTETEQKITDADQVKLKTFKWHGPLNVPGHTIYSYGATGGKKGAESKWIDADEGTVKSTIEKGDKDANGKVISEDRVSVLWDSGPAIGGPIYRAAPGFDWKLDVNVVQIDFSDMKITAGTSPGVGNLCGILGTVSGTKNVGMTATGTVTITGPEVDGVQRGVKFIEVGFLQISTSRDEFNAKAKNGGDSITIHHRMEGSTRMLDQITKSCTSNLKTNWPWYDATGVGDRIGFFEGSNEEGEVTIEMEIQDTPGVGLITTQFGFDGRLGWTPTEVNILWKFELNMATRTTDPGVMNHEVKNFTKIAEGFWRWDGDADLVEKDGKPVWVADNPKVTVDQDLTEVTEGELIEWFNKNGAVNTQPFNNFLDPWLEVRNNVWQPHRNHTVK